MSTCVIFNPSARGEKARAFSSRLERIFPDCIWRRTAQAGQARAFAAQAVREKFQTIIAGGGDGTVNEVINGIGDVPGGFETAQLGVLPLGTVNVFARELGLPRGLPALAKILAAGKTRVIDLGHAEYAVKGGRQQRFFAQLAGAGLDSRAIELVDWNLKKRAGAIAYLAAGWKALAEKQPVICVQGETGVTGEIVLIGNGRFYGGSFEFFPGASLQDGLLDVCVVPRVSWPRLIPAGIGLLTGRFHQFSSALLLRLPSVKLTSLSRVLLQLDGENVGELPATLSMRTKALRVIVP